MKKTFSSMLVALTVFLVDAFAQTTKHYDYAYKNDKGICAYSIAPKNEVVATRGVNPCISPDGTKIAYTDQSKGRRIAVIDLNTSQKTILNTNSDNCYGPVWSPDGRFIAYNIFMGSDWGIAIISANNHQPAKIISKTLKSCYMPTWTLDSQHIIGHDMNIMYVFNINGEIIKKFNINQTGQKEGINSTSRFWLTQDNNKLIFDASIGENGLDDEANSIFVYDFITKETKRISPKGYYCSELFLSGDKLIFTGYKPKSDIPNMYSVNLDGSNLKMEIASCEEPSARRLIHDIIKQ